MKLGISSYTYTWAVGVPGSQPREPLGAMGLLEKARTLEIDVLQIADNVPLDRLSDDEIASLGAAADDAGVIIEVGTRGIDSEHLQRYLDLAARLRSPILRVVVDTVDHQPSPETIVETFNGVAPELARSGIVLAIENHDRFRADIFADIVARVGGRHVGICLDTVNSFGAREGVREVVACLGPLTMNLHVKDFHVHRVDHQMGFVIEGRPAGQGHLDVPWLLRQMRRYDRDPNAIIELWTPPAESVEATIAREDEWARQSVSYMKRILPEFA